MRRDPKNKIRVMKNLCDCLKFILDTYLNGDEAKLFHKAHVKRLNIFTLNGKKT
tara:strand:- start:505 stop:666 length:162 start_codon:yes stop_codon:yes gene_type:complete